MGEPPEEMGYRLDRRYGNGVRATRRHGLTLRITAKLRHLRRIARWERVGKRFIVLRETWIFRIGLPVRLGFGVAIVLM
jgi:hypothetical protein